MLRTRVAISQDRNRATSISFPPEISSSQINYMKSFDEHEIQNELKGFAVDSSLTLQRDPFPLHITMCDSICIFIMELTDLIQDILCPPKRTEKPDWWPSPPTSLYYSPPSTIRTI